MSTVSPVSDPASNKLTQKKVLSDFFYFMGSAMSNPQTDFPQESERKDLSFKNVFEGVRLRVVSVNNSTTFLFSLFLVGRECWRRLVVSARKCIQMAWSLEPNQAIP